MSTPAPPTADQLRASALAKLQQARDLIDAARHDMCNLEGIGYAKEYRKLLIPYDQLAEHMHRIRALKPPTGVFKV